MRTKKSLQIDKAYTYTAQQKQNGNIITILHTSPVERDEEVCRKCSEKYKEFLGFLSCMKILMLTTKTKVKRSYKRG